MRIKNFLRRNQKKLWILPVVMGIMILVQTARHRQGPLRDEPAGEEPATSVIAAAVLPAGEAPWIRGFGTVKPARTWRAVADLPGRIVEIHSSLKDGSLVRKGDLLIRIDDSEYRLALQQQEAALAQAAADLKRLGIRETADRASLKTELRTLEIYEKDLQRYRNLLAEGGVSRSRVDDLERAALVETQKVQSLRKSLSTFPSERTALKARISGLESAVSRARIDLEHCTIRAPFDGRIANMAVELKQFVTGGRELLIIEDMSSMEINVQVGLDRIASLELGRRKEIPASAVVRLQGATGEWFQWPARFDRDFHRVDPLTRTAGIVVTVDDILSGDGTIPLMSGMYCEVRLIGQKIEGLLTVPRKALHGRNVYRITSENRLEYREVERVDGDGPDILIRSGLKEGDLVVLSDLAAPIPGMKLNPVLEKDMPPIREVGERSPRPPSEEGQ